MITTKKKEIRVAICTLVEGDYVAGLGALANSLELAGFSGTLIAGTRSDADLRIIDLLFQNYIISVSFNFYTKRVNHFGHLTNSKPDVMLQIFNELGSDLDAIVFIDPDIVVQAPWSFFDFWLRDHIALCSDVTRFAMHATHPTKLRWRRIAESLGYGWHDDTGYANAGFIGVPVEHIDFLRLWRDLGRQLEEHGFFDKAIFNHFDLCHPFGAADQDVLNMVRHITDRPLSLAGQEGMGFIPGRAYMLHAAGPRKPWRGGFLRDALRYGRRPSNVAKAFWNSVREPVPVFGRTRVALAKAELHAATLVARLTG